MDQSGFAFVLLLFIAITLFALLGIIKNGFNQVIKGLEAIAERQDREYERRRE